jgi:polyisoprenoid-binding protein YceI
MMNARSLLAATFPRAAALAATLALLALSAAAPARAVEYRQIDPAKSSLVFVTRQMGVAVDGRFRRFAAAVRFDPAAPAAAHAELTIDLASIDTGVPEADEEVTGRDWFDTARHPQARFVARQFKALGGNRFEAQGELTIKGITRTVSAPFTIREAAGRAVVDGRFTIQRSDFNVGSGIWADPRTVANEVELRFRLEATR